MQGPFALRMPPLHVAMIQTPDEMQDRNPLKARHLSHSPDGQAVIATITMLLFGLPQVSEGEAEDVRSQFIAWIPL